MTMRHVTCMSHPRGSGLQSDASAVSQTCVFLCVSLQFPFDLSQSLGELAGCTEFMSSQIWEEQRYRQGSHKAGELLLPSRRIIQRSDTQPSVSLVTHTAHKALRQVMSAGELKTAHYFSQVKHSASQVAYSRARKWRNRSLISGP